MTDEARATLVVRQVDGHYVLEASDGTAIPGELPVVDADGKALATYIVSTQPIPEVRVGYLQLQP
ncbi:hypothetical protein ACFVZD_46675 [Streptomyces sp. NPDC058287]|uniref:hypothetical protein n=1 Tax=Streptomyces sp. NPDC058287 TaxID=3346423 RepID=UPI0036EBA86E